MIQHSVDASDKKAIKKMVAALSLPAIVEQIMLSAVQYVDTAMVGSLGAAATASVGISTSFVWLINGLLNAISVGLSVQVAQHMGANDMEAAKGVVKQAIKVCFFVGIIISLVSMLAAPFIPVWMGGDIEIIPGAVKYFRIFSLTFAFNLFGTVCSAMIRCTGDMRTPMIVSFSSNIVNVIFNTLLIFPTREVNIMGKSFTMWGAGMGVAGAAAGSVIAAVFLGFIMFWTIIIKENPLKIHIRECAQKNIGVVKNMVSLGVPVFLERATITAGQIVSTIIVTGLGTVALASHTLAISAESIAYLPCVGISYAATTLVGQSIGAKKKDLAIAYSGAANMLGLKMLTCVGLLLFLFPSAFIRVFTGDAAVIALGGSVLKIEALAQPLSAIGIVCAGAFRGAGDSKSPFIIGFAGMWLIRIPLAMLLIYKLGFGLSGIWIAMCIDISMRGIMSIYKYFRTDWAFRADSF